MRRAATLGVVVLLLVLAPVWGAAGASAQEDVVTLTVSVETSSGTAVGGAELTASWDGGSASTTTASNGMAFLDVPDGADVTIEVTHDDYIRNHPLRINDVSSSEVTVTVAEKASASLRIVDEEGAVSGARIQMVKDRRTAAQGNTGSNGAFASGTIEAGEYTVRVFKQGYFRFATTVEVEGDINQEIEVERGFVTVTFRVTDDHFDPPRPVPDVSVEVGEIGSVNTGSNGVQRLSVPVNTEVVVTTSKEGYRRVEARIATEESDRTVEIRVQREPAVVLEALNQNVVAGERLLVAVTDEYGDPVPNATVSLDGSPVATTDASGEALVEVDTVGEHTVTAELGELTSEPRTVRGIRAADATTTPGSGDATPMGSGATDEASPDETTTPGLDGFGIIAALVAMALAVAAAVSRRR